MTHSSTISTDYDPWAWFDIHWAIPRVAEKVSARLESRQYVACQSRLSGRIKRSKKPKCLPGQKTLEFS